MHVCTTQWTVRALMAASTLLSAPSGVRLAARATISARPRSTTCMLRQPPCRRFGLVPTSSPGWKRQTAAAAGGGTESGADAGVLVETNVCDGAANSGSALDERIGASGRSNVEVLSRATWTERAEAHRERVRALTGGSVHHDRRDPIFNFLFEYYHFKPRMLLQWTPGFGVDLLDADPSLKGCPLPQKAWEPGTGRGGRYDPFRLEHNRRVQVRWMRDLLRATSARAPVFHCFGLHEWAMLYRPSVGAKVGTDGIDTRSVHQELPLRVSQEQINEMVEGKGGALACTHFDAFRFFTPEARPLNPVQLKREGQMSHDQPGCVHANMDLFKWALRLWPLLPSERMADALELAVSCRVLDMRASPYDLTAHFKAPDDAIGKGGGRVGGVPPEAWDPTPVKIETEEGRREYQQAQWELYKRSMPVRQSLSRHMDRLLEVWGD